VDSWRVSDILRNGNITAEGLDEESEMHSHMEVMHECPLRIGSLDSQVFNGEILDRFNVCPNIRTVLNNCVSIVYIRVVV
jgi:hypothetical protein